MEAASVHAAVGWLRARPRARVALQAGAAAVTVGFCAFGVASEWSKAGPRLEHADPLDFALALAAVAAYYLVFILGWIRILDGWGIRIGYRTALQAEMVSMLAKYLPGGVWTPAARALALRRQAGVTETSTVLASILVEAALSAISGVIVFVISLAWVHGVNAPLAPLVAFGVLCALVLHPRVFRPVARRLLRPFGAESIDPLPYPLMLSLLLFYCGTWLIGGLGLWFLLGSVGTHPSLSAIPFLGGTAAVGAIVAVLAVFAPSGLGWREGAMYGLLLALTTTGPALGATLLNRLAITVVELALFGAGALSWRRRPTRPAPQPPAA